MIVIGLGIVAFDLSTKYLERRSVSKELEAFMEAVAEPSGEMPSEGSDANVWGTIEIDKIGVNHLIAKTNDWSYLNRYVVAYESSPNPPANGNFSIAGHNGNCASCVFRDFDKLEKGDSVRLNDKENTYTYEIKEIFEVYYDEVSVLNDTPDKQTLTLITCTEQSNYSKYRTIVKAEMVSSVPNT